MSATERPVLETEEETSPPAQDLILPVLPLEQFVLFPSMVAPIIVGDAKSKVLVDDALGGERTLVTITKRLDGEDLGTFASLYTVGTSATIMKMLKMPDDTLRLLLHGQTRVRLVEIIGEEPYLKGRFEEIPEEELDDEAENEALMQALHQGAARAVESLNLPEDLKVAAMNLNDPGKLADLVASNLGLKPEEQQAILETADLRERMKMVLRMLSHQIELHEIGSRIQTEVKSEIDKNQRDYILREQMRAIRRELGEDEGNTRELDELEQRIAAKPMPDYARDAARKELNRLRVMQPASAEYTVARTYLDTILELPWEESTEDSLDIKRAHAILDEDHYGLETVKERILEFLSVRRLKNDMRGPILCFVGPPGVGKTSLGRSIARAMGRKFYRFSLGGMHDEAEIRGHRRTYVGAMPGRILKGLKQAGANNPVIMLDEIDKLGSTHRGDPASALLEVLDPEQNAHFNDNYLDMPFDLSKVFFITTANMPDPIPGPLRDRMDVIQLAGYTVREKMSIARKYLVPRQVAENGLTSRHIRFANPALLRLIEFYTREAGLRSLERQIATVCRKVARMVAEGRKTTVNVSARSLDKLLGAPKYFSDTAQRVAAPGTSIGLAWTPVGGEILYIEAGSTPGQGRLMLTGQMGDVMKESAQAALTYLHSQAARFGIDADRFAKTDIHLHIPAGAIPKDGPSAGTAMCTALASLFLGRSVKSYLAMTGEITIKGNVLPIGGLKEKVLAAARAGITEVLLPERNVTDLEQVPDEIRKTVKFRGVKHMDEVLQAALAIPLPRRNSARKKAAAAPKKTKTPARKKTPARPPPKRR